MRNLFPRLLLLITSALLATALTASAQNIPTNGLTAHWSFELDFDNALYASGNSALGSTNLDLAAVNGTDFETGLFGMAAHFDGTDDYLEIFKANPSDDKEIVEDQPAGTSTRTFSVWFKVDQAPSGSARYMVYETAPNYTYSLGLREDTADNANTTIQLFSNRNTEGAINVSVKIPDSELAGQWVHALAIYRLHSLGQLQMELIINGTTAGIITQNMSSGLTLFDDFHIGTYRSASGRWFPGLIDELAVWERELTATEKEELSTLPPVIVTISEDEDGGPNSLTNPTDISLREAINHAPHNSIISFDPSLTGQTLTLSSGQLLINRNLTIDASAIGGITIDADNLSRVFEIAIAADCVFNALAITGGSAPGGNASNLDGEHGGGILNHGTLSVIHCYLHENRAGNGAFAGFGGFSDGNGGYGGGIYNSGNLTVQNSTLSDNHSGKGANGVGGGSTGGHGGGIFNSGTLTLLNSTLTGNTTDTGENNDNRGNGGGIYTDGNAILKHTTMIDNSVDQGDTFPGLGYNIHIASGTATITNSILAEIPASPIVNISGSFTGAGNLFDDYPMLADLGDYGGITPTRPPLHGSPAIDASGNSPLTHDQRGIPRTDGMADTGAVERQSTIVLNSNDSGPGSLRQILEILEPDPQITFTNSLSGTTVLLTSGQLVIAHDASIDASAIGGITIDGNANSRIFEVASDTISTLTSLTLTNGTTEFQGSALGGAIYINSDAELTINHCTLSGNDALFGGAIANHFGTLTINHSTLSGNNADNSGGAIDHFVGTLTINHSTLSENSAAYSGGGIYNNGILMINQSTLSKNNAGNNGGGIRNTGTLTINNTIVAGNHGSDVFGSIGSGSNNLTSDDPLLAPLGHYGGPTQTMPPLPGSPAIDAGGPSSFVQDQRGYSRAAGESYWKNDFSSDLAGANVLVNAGADPATGTIDAGSFLCTPELFVQQASLVLPPPGAFSSFSASFDFFYRIPTSSASIADGFSFSFGPEPTAPVLESGLNGGHQVSFKTWNLPYSDPISLIRYIRKDGMDTNITSGTTYNTSAYADQWHRLTVELTSGGLLTVSLNGAIVLETIDTSYSWSAGDTFTLAARTGGFYTEQRIDNVSIQIDPVTDIGAVELQGTTDLAQFWSMDWDGDGNPFGVEYALGTDPLTADGTNGLNSMAHPSGGVIFGYNPTAASSAAWVIKRSLDLVSDPFVEVYRFDGPSGGITATIPYSVNPIGASVEVLDLTTPQPTNAFYQLDIELVP
ncbi:choice-of-anchor Q domain-containing protein [Pontiellaceae bacterium B12227]|nr:choice-of-anchor Q domain-containing protein [Pontiellaceae bacterium B12227]